MADSEKGKSHKEDIIDYTMDGTVDIKGRPCLRSKGGRWFACSFIVVFEAFERLAYFGVAPNLVVYLTNKLHQGTVESANNVTNWYGTIMLTPILGAYIADSYLGRYWTFIFSSAVYLLGMILLTLTVSLPSLRPSTCNSLDGEDCKNHTNGFQVAIFFLALYIIAVGAGGIKPNISTLGADQFDVHNTKERAQKLSFFNWWTCGIFCGNLLSSTVLIYIQDNVSFTVGYIIPTMALAFSILVFILGTPLYRHKLPSGSPITKIAQVLVATIRKWKVPHTIDSKELYEHDSEYYSKKGKNKIKHSASLRFFDKAAVMTGSNSPWMLCPVTQIEETKQIIKLLPVCMTTIIPSVMMAQVLTLFIKQGVTLNRNIGPHFQIPPASLSSFFTIGALISVIIYDRIFVPLLRKHTKNPRGISMLQRIGIGQALHIFIMSMAALIERWRLSIVRDHDLIHKRMTIVPLTVFALLPQFALMGVAEMLVEVGKMEFFYDQAPEGMKSLGASFFTTTVGIGYFASSFLLSTVAKVTRKGGRNGWIENDLNKSHLDYYYEFFVVLNVINFILFLLVSKFYVYNREVIETGQNEMKEIFVEFVSE
ncbi:hypothetical protein IEQ34_015266 [Dendrobium chrysotoxum]|uniref:Uncharacterized protein n=1 Tax=Dendrobium chrysotoxum TaxID=161865 RepID=A0AAV7G069_DENCH|nr:hypothetical protein IEQ34_015266 [Dendrobium chrysotoxum]